MRWCVSAERAALRCTGFLVALGSFELLPSSSARPQFVALSSLFALNSFHVCYKLVALNLLLSLGYCGRLRAGLGTVLFGFGAFDLAPQPCAASVFLLVCLPSLVLALVTTAPAAHWLRRGLPAGREQGVLTLCSWLCCCTCTGRCILECERGSPEKK